MSRFPWGLSLVIPCLNESATIARAVTAARQTIAQLGIAGEVLVIDNASNDDSATLARDAGAEVITEPERGYGAAIDRGIQTATYECVGFADADLSYPFGEFSRLYECLQNEGADLVLGSRLRGKIDPQAMPLLNRYVGTPALSLILGWLAGLPTSDCNSGMRLLRHSVYDRLNLRARGMEYACEMLVRFAQAGLRYREVPIRFHRDARGRPPHLQRWRDGWRSLSMIVQTAASST